MSITVTLDDNLAARLENQAKMHQVSAEELALRILGSALEGCTLPTPREVVAKIQATPPDTTQIRPATSNLANVLLGAPEDPSFDLETWNRQWSVVEVELKAVTRANDVAEGRGQ